MNDIRYSCLRAEKPVVLYHGQCRDGFCAAFCFWMSHGDNFKYVAAQYGSPLAPEVLGAEELYIVDFCLPAAELKRLEECGVKITVLDHHKTARDEVAASGIQFGPSTKIVFDMDRSGAQMAWDYLNPGNLRPWIVDYVGDRDLWRNALEETTAVNAYTSTLEFDFERWYGAMKRGRFDAIRNGIAVESKIRQYVAETSKNARFVSWEGHEGVPVVNAPQTDVSELGSFLAQGKPLAVAWWQRSDGKFVYSLRSREPSDVDVSAIAKHYGGGGHVRAAGFQLNELIF